MIDGSFIWLAKWMMFRDAEKNGHFYYCAPCFFEYEERN